jgi:hypothetical protein
MGYYFENLIPQPEIISLLVTKYVYEVEGLYTQGKEGLLAYSLNL